MLKTDTLEELCQEMHYYPLDWDRVIERFILHPGVNKDIGLTRIEYAKHFSEIHLDLMLEDLSIKHPEFNISFEPLNHSKTQGDCEIRPEIIKQASFRPKHIADELATVRKINGFEFYYDLAGRMMTRKEGENYEYDKVIMVNDVPVDFEIKIAKSSVILPHLKPEIYEQRLEPLRELFNSDLARVMIVPTESYDKWTEVNEEKVWVKYQENNGMIIPFYTSREDFKMSALEVTRQHGYAIRPARTKSKYTIQPATSAEMHGKEVYYLYKETMTIQEVMKSKEGILLRKYKNLLMKLDSKLEKHLRYFESKEHLNRTLELTNIDEESKEVIGYIYECVMVSRI
jgi:hypothetical protein